MEGATRAEFDHHAAVAAAVRAPSMHNIQPWRFRLQERGVEVRLDPERRLPASDPTGWAARLAAGAAVFNLRLSLAVQGWQPHTHLLPSPEDPDLIAVVTAGEARTASPTERQLWEAVERRRSNREPFWPDQVPAALRARLVAAARAENAWLEQLLGSGPLAAFAAIARAADAMLMRDAGYRAEIAAWTRDGESHDGVPAEAGGPRPEPQDLLPARPFTSRPRKPGRELEAHPLIAVLGTVGDTAGDQVIAGQALQRVLLTATADDLSVSLLSQPIEVPGIREELRIALGRYGSPQMVLRIGYGVPGPVTPRRPVAEFLDSPVPAGPTARSDADRRP